MANVIEFPTNYRPAAEYIDITGVAAIVRGELKREFPGTKFSVRISRYSMGSNCRVSWTDGPTTRQVDAVIGRFGGTTFDGMDDSTHHHDSEWNGRRVHFAGMGPSTDRDVTDYKALEAAALQMIRTRCDLDETGTRFGNDWIDNLAARMVHACDFRVVQPLERAFRFVIFHEEG